MPVLMKNSTGQTLYAVCYEQGVRNVRANIVYLHARDRGDAVNQVLRTMSRKGVRIIGIAPAVGLQYQETKRSKDTPELFL